MNRILKPAIAVVAVVFILVIAKNLIAQMAVQAGVKAMTGVDLSMKGFDLGILSGRVHIKGMHLANPKGFEEKTMVDMPEILVETDLPAILGGKVHVKNIRIHLQQFDVIKNKDGKLNLDAFNVVSQTKDEKPKEVKKKEEAKPMDLQVDRLTLRIDKVSYIDHSLGGKTIRKDFNVNIHEEFTNITDPNALVSVIIVKALRNTTIGQLANVDLGAISDVGERALQSGKQLATETQRKAEEALASMRDNVGIQGVKDASREMADKTGESVKEAANSVKDVADGLLGSVKAKVSGGN